MLTSGNGQHRRPRQAPKFVVTVGAGIALPLLSSGAAHAASATTWDEVASCETGGAWNANAGDGFYGGLALTLNVWERYGGTVYAKSPDLASRQQQIAVAQKVLDGQGAGYWTGCAIAVGLAQGGPTPEVNPGTPAPGGGAASDPGLLGGLLHGLLPTPAPTASPAPSSSPSVPTSDGSVPSSGSSVVPGSSAPAASGSVAPAPSSSPTASAGRHAKPPATGGDLGGTGTPGSGTHARPPAGGADGPQSGPYVVQPGDNLYEIATDNSLPGGWPSLYDVNRSIVGPDPDLILPGQRLTLG